MIRSVPKSNDRFIGNVGWRLNEQTYDDRELNAKYSYPDFDRSTHARFLEKLRNDGAPLVVFDIFFKRDMPEDAEFAKAISSHGNVILAAQVEAIGDVEYAGSTTNLPASAFRALPGCTIALPDLWPDATVVRTFPEESEVLPSIALASALARDASVEAKPGAPRWVRYYGAEGTLPTETYQSAINRPPGYFRGKTVFIGGKPKTDYLLGKSDAFNTALTRWTRATMRGVEIHATMYLNLIRNEWLMRLPRAAEVILILTFGISFASVASYFR